MHRVTDIKKVQPFRVLIEFDNQELRWLELESRLTDWSEGDMATPFGQLLNPAEFEKVKVNPVGRTLEWENGLDFCPDMLYQWSEKTTNYGA